MPWLFGGDCGCVSSGRDPVTFLFPDCLVCHYLPDSDLQLFFWGGGGQLQIIPLQLDTYIHTCRLPVSCGLRNGLKMKCASVAMVLLFQSSEDLMFFQIKFGEKLRGKL